MSTSLQQPRRKRELSSSARVPAPLRDRLLNNIDRYVALPMFVASLAFLACLAVTLQDLRAVTLPPRLSLFWWGMVLLYPLFIAELATHWLIGSTFWRQHMLFCLLPPLRLGGRDHQTGESVWLPFWGWCRTCRELRERVEKAVSGPMIVIALMVLPVLAIEFFWSEQAARRAWLAFALETGTTMIWLAFTIEFIVMISIVDKKLSYCRQHWVDLVVICLPFVAFLRVLRLGQLARLQQVSRLTRVYRMRGLTMRTYRAILALGVIRYFVRIDPERRLEALRASLAEKEQELDDIRAEIRDLEGQISAQKRDG